MPPLISGRHLFKPFRVVWSGRAPPALTTLWFQHFQKKPRFYHVSVLRCDAIEEFIAIFVVSLQKSQSRRKPFSAYFAHLWAFSAPILRETCDILACDDKVETIAGNLRKFTPKFWNCEAPSLASNKIIAHYRWQTTSLFIDHFENFYTIVLQFLHLLHFGRKPHIIHGGLPHHLGFNMNNTKFTAGKIINHRTQWRQEQTPGCQLIRRLQDIESCDDTTHARGLPYSYSSHFPNIPLLKYGPVSYEYQVAVISLVASCLRKPRGSVTSGVNTNPPVAIGSLIAYPCIDYQRYWSTKGILYRFRAWYNFNTWIQISETSVPLKTPCFECTSIIKSKPTMWDPECFQKVSDMFIMLRYLCLEKVRRVCYNSSLSQITWILE
jgi:hypothetical protein